MAKKSRRRRRATKDTHSRVDTVAFAARHMRKDPDIKMGELAKLGAPEGYHIYPLILGLARKELGMARKTPPTGAPRKKAARKRSKVAAPAARRGPGRPAHSMTASDALQSLVERMRQLERESDTLRRSLQKIQDLASAK